MEEALERILAFVHRLEPERRPLPDALGQVLAADAVAGCDIPPLDNTAMDGYAVRAADTADASESNTVRLRIAGELAAGYLYDGEVAAGTAVRIMTGAPMPRGADAVVPFEETDEQVASSEHRPGKFQKGAETVGILKAAKQGANVRNAGEDVRQGDMSMRAGTTLNAAQIGVPASLGYAGAAGHRG